MDTASLPDLPTDLIDAKEASKLARSHIACIHRWMQSGRLRAWKRAGRFFVSRADVLALFKPVQPAR